VGTVDSARVRAPGRRGSVTRERLMAATAELLATRPYRAVTVTDVARAAGTSPATFYQYFADLESMVLALAEDVARDGARLSAPLSATRWRGADGWHNCLAVVDAFLDFWCGHRSILRVVDLLTEEGDERLRAVRVRMLNVVTRELATVIVGVRAASGEATGVEPTGADAGAEPTGADAMAVAAVLVSMLAHVAAHQERYDDWDISLASVRDAMADVMYWAVTGPRVPQHPRPRTGRATGTATPRW
jgi:AcrR family transcriptional regulator